jgi:hypothetical protein
MQMNKKSIIILLLGIFIAMTIHGQSKKDLQLENQVLQVATDSLRRSLAEARREWQKCKDNSFSNQEELVRKKNSDQELIKRLNTKLAETEKRALQISDTLRLTKDACEQLQSGMAKVSQVEFALTTRAETLQNKLNVALVDWIGTNVSLLRHKGKVSITMSDSIVFGGGSYVNASGQKLLTKIIQVIQPYDNIKLVVNAWQAHTINLKDGLAESSRRALSVSLLLEIYKWPVDRIMLVGQGLWPSGNSKHKSPIRIDILPLEDRRF